MNSYAIEFDVLHNYDTLQTGITVPVLLKYGDNEIKFDAKIDTGSSHCIFQRSIGESIGIAIEAGEKERFGTATTGFAAYAHEVTISVLGIETFARVYFFEDEYIRKSVLGRQGWLDRVKLGLVDYDEKLFLSRYEK